MSSGFRLRAMVTWRQMWTESDWNVENGFEPFDSLSFDLILSMEVSENLKSFSLKGGSASALPLDVACGLLASPSPLDVAFGSEGGGISSFTRVLRDLVRSRKGGTEMVEDPLQISAHELMKCHVDVPSRIAWLNAQPIASPSFSLVSCGQYHGNIQ